MLNDVGQKDFHKVGHRASLNVKQTSRVRKMTNWTAKLSRRGVREDLHFVHESFVDVRFVGWYLGIHLNRQKDEKCIERLEVHIVGVLSAN